MYPTVLAIVGVVFFLGNVLTDFLWGRKTPSYDLEIDDDGIRLMWNRKAARIVRKNHVRYVGEWGSGTFRKLVVSEHGQVFTRWLWGGIGVPVRLSDQSRNPDLAGKFQGVVHFLCDSPSRKSSPKNLQSGSDVCRTRSAAE
jgi:hypothetical protein